MAFRIIEHGSDDYRQMLELRDEVLRKPLGLSISNDDLTGESGDILVAAFEEERMVACCLLTPVDKFLVKLRQMAVRSEVQGKGVGKALILFAESVSGDRGFSRIIMHARATAVGFYLKLGYNICSPEFEEVTIPHYSMEKSLP